MKEMVLERGYRVRWTNDERKFSGTFWGYEFTPFGDLLVVHPYSSEIDVKPTEWEQRISFEDLFFVDPLVIHE